MTHARTEETPHESRRKGLLVGLGVAVAVAVTIAVIVSLFLGSPNKGHGAELNPQSVRDALPSELEESWTSDMCFVMMDKPRGLGAAPEDVPAELPAINCLLDDGTPNGISTTMASDENFAGAVTDPADGVDMIELGSSSDGAHEVSWLAETGLLYVVTEESVLRFGPYADESAARAFATEHGMLEAE